MFQTVSKEARGIGFPGAGVTDRYELLNVGIGYRTWSSGRAVSAFQLCLFRLAQPGFELAL